MKVIFDKIIEGRFFIMKWELIITLICYKILKLFWRFMVFIFIFIFKEIIFGTLIFV